MTTTHSIRSCPQCNQPLPPDAPEGLCPECLMLGGLETAPLPKHLKPSGRLPEPGETFGDYRIGQKLGRGGMGAVFEAEQIETGRRVALKLLNHQLDSPEARARFLREGRLAASINHPNSVYVFGTEEIGDMPAITMELVRGGTLETRVKEGGPLPPGEAVDTILQVISGLEAAQQIGILHRDVKPGNCFQDVDGTVKIGDFGLSLSTEAREDNNLTIDGSILGTPAFSSPEQLRGEELNVRSDIYAVGATLFCLLTGQTVFHGKSVAQLFANVLEKEPPSPQAVRPDLPVGLAAVVVRCLDKIPAERFASYAELRRALLPYSSEAPVPASIPLRFAAGFIDWFLFLIVTTTAQLFLFGDDSSPNPYTGLALILNTSFGFATWILYFAFLEGRLGYSIGKGICHLRVATKEGTPPGKLTAALRAAIVLVLPSLPLVIRAILSPDGSWIVAENAMDLIFVSSFYVIFALLFITVRRKNGYAAVQDLTTRTRVIRKKDFQERPGLPEEHAKPVIPGEESPVIGPYHFLEVLENDDSSEWLLGYDTRLLRKVWIRKVDAGSPPVAPALRQLGRPGRLRWLAGRRSPDENWDAYEAPEGQSLSDLLATRIPAWGGVRYWLHDIAEEWEASGRDGSAPRKFSLNRVWITSDGRAKLLDFPAPGSPDEESEIIYDRASDLVEAIAAVTATSMPIHALKLREQLPFLKDPVNLLANLKPLLHRNCDVSRKRRASLVVGCITFPLIGVLLMQFGIRTMEQWRRDQPELLELNQVLALRQAYRSPILRHEDRTPDDVFAIFIAGKYRDIIKNPDIWHSSVARTMIAGEKRRFAEESLIQFPDPSTEQLRDAEATLGPIVTQPSRDQLAPSWIPPVSAFFGIMLAYTILPAILAAAICRGGLVMLACGVAVAKVDGTAASRLRCLWRSLVTWAPLLANPPIIIGLLHSSLGMGTAAAIAGSFVLLLTVISLCLPERGLQDRIAGTCLVPR